MEANQSKIKTWCSFESVMLAGFPSFKNVAFYHIWLLTRKWHKEETLPMGCTGGFNEETTISCIVNGLWSVMWSKRSSESRINDRRPT
uniref:Uncharacterized protein n=1 Tax=Anopheles arabiensis TaxID=7173 RepID=A0A182HVF6_ANOAR